MASGTSSDERGGSTEPTDPPQPTGLGIYTSGIRLYNAKVIPKLITWMSFYYPSLFSDTKIEILQPVPPKSPMLHGVLIGQVAKMDLKLTCNY